MSETKKAFIFGLGYVGQRFGRLLMQKGYEVSGTVRDLKKIKPLTQEGFKVYPFYPNMPLPHGILSKHSVVLVTIPPVMAQNYVDLTYHLNAPELVEHASDIKWLGYISTTGVYGNHDGEWVNEDSPLKQTFPKGQRRIVCENQWLSLFHYQKIPVQIFRFSSIYGPNRSVVDRLLSGKVQAIDKPGHFFSRIYIDDALDILWDSMTCFKAGEVYNIADDEPCSSLEMLQYACNVMNHPMPSLVPFDQAVLSATMHEFYLDNKKVSNTKIKSLLPSSLKFPNYRHGIDHIWKENHLWEKAI